MATLETLANDLPAAVPQYPKDDGVADFGDFVSTEQEEIELEEVVEPLEKYDETDNPHVFYPICVGEVINERYLIEHKLGSGGFSTVWMAHDIRDMRNVAVKVMSSGDWADAEARAQEMIVQNVHDTSHLVTYLDTFHLSGNNRRQRVLVFPLMGPCLSYCILKKMSMATRMSAARQLLEALENLHKAGIVHRDLNERNCMWGMVPHNLNRKAKYEALGRPVKVAIADIELWKPGELVIPAHIPENLRTEQFYLGDFGLAMKVGDPITQEGCPPRAFCSPDRFYGKHPSFACDMWSYMVIFAMLCLNVPPFTTWQKGGLISGMVKCLGPLPEEWKGLYKPSGELDYWYDQCTTPDPKLNVAARIENLRPDLDATERELVHSIMSKVFVFRPEERLNATQLLHDPSFRALMERYGC